MSQHGGGQSGVAGGASKTGNERMELESVEEVTERNARLVKDEQDRLLAWMRRNTPLTDDQIKDALGPYANLSFNAGQEIGWTEAMHRANWSARRNRMLSWVTFVVTAALVASVWLLFRR